VAGGGGVRWAGGGCVTHPEALPGPEKGAPHRIMKYAERPN
jgi:hypothetical protein